MQLIFFAGIVLVVFLFFPFTFETYRSISRFLESKPAGYRWPQLSDFWFTIVTTMILGLLERAFEYTFYPWFYNICKEKNDLEERDRRTRKAV
jgi:hypothetical protein